MDRWSRVFFRQHSRIIPDLLMFAFIVAASMRLSSGLEECMDIRLADETGYLMRGVMMPVHSIDPAFSPLYSLWYKLLHQFNDDAIALYYLNYRLMAILPAIALYLALRVCGAPFALTILLTFFFIISSKNLPMWPKLSHMTLLVLLAGLALQKIWAGKSAIAGLAIACFSALVAAFLRPEFYLSFLFIGIALLIHMAATTWQFLQNESAGEKPHSALAGVRGLCLAVALLALAGTGLHLFFGFPLTSESRRPWVAFSQHFGTNWVEKHGGPLDPLAEFEQIYENVFGPERGLSKAVWANPGAFRFHVSTNLRKYARTLPSVTGHFLLPDRIFPFGTKPKLAIFGLVGLLCVALPNARLGLSRRARGNIRKDWPVYLAIGAFLAPSIISCVVLYPRDHYVVFQGVLLVFAAAILIGNQHKSAEKGPSKWRWAGFAILALVGIPATPTAHYFYRDSMNNVRNIQALRALAQNETPRVLDCGEAYIAYLAINPRQYINPWNKPGNAIPYLTDEKADWILMGNGFPARVIYFKDKDWLKLQIHPEEFGFSRVDLLEPYQYALLRHSP